jgi:predicted hotdog family 3-hydroxylacyl-ACP dehydratase
LNHAFSSATFSSPTFSRTAMNPAAPQLTRAASPATLDHAGIAARVPHSGSMCLLDRLLAWDDLRIVCSAISHADPNNPLRTAAGLLSANGIEYAAQAMALHGVLCASADPTKNQAAGSAPQAGFLASVRGVRLREPRLDTVPGALRITATRVAGDAAQAMYSFSLHDEQNKLLVQGRATVILATQASTYTLT